jgi:acyl dehydratase
MSVTTMRADDVHVGDRLPDLVVDVTSTLVIAGALASRDYQDVHHDRDAAQGAGARDVFMNILTTNGFVGRYVTDWAGPEAVLKKVSIRLGAPNYPGDQMQMTGNVTGKDADAVEVEVRGVNRLGDHVVGTVRLELPGTMENG